MHRLFVAIQPPRAVRMHLLGLIAASVAGAPAFEAAGFCLYESTLGRDGASYAIVARYPLG